MNIDLISSSMKEEKYYVLVGQPGGRSIHRKFAPVYSSPKPTIESHRVELITPKEIIHAPIATIKSDTITLHI